MSNYKFYSFFSLYLELVLSLSNKYTKNIMNDRYFKRDEKINIYNVVKLYFLWMFIESLSRIYILSSFSFILLQTPLFESILEKKSNNFTNLIKIQKTPNNYKAIERESWVCMHIGTWISFLILVIGREKKRRINF